MDWTGPTSQAMASILPRSNMPYGPRDWQILFQKHLNNNMDLGRLRELCLRFPGATEGLKWEDHICFMVAEKMFCITRESGGASFKVNAEEFEEIIEKDGIVPT